MHAQSNLSTNWLRRRPELQIHATADNTAAGTEKWIVFDPVRRRSFRVGKLEHWLLENLKVSQDVERLVTQCSRQFSESLPRERIQLAILNFQQNGLLLQPPSSLAPQPQNRVDSASVAEHWNLRLQGWLARLMVWRMPGLSADRLLERLLPYSGPFFSRSAVRFWLAMALLTGVMLALSWDRLIPRVDLAGWILQPRALTCGLCILLLTRCIHELGHALTCKLYGVRCPDIGLLFVLGAPCLYCDVSESWRLPKRSQRAAIAAGGIYAELVVATLAAWCWMLTVDGLFNTLAMHTLLICSISTLAFNANPLMRFDGYHILADILDETNLRTKADGIALRGLENIALGPTSNTSTSTGNRRTRMLGVYAVLSWLYRFAIVMAIAGVFYSVLTAWNLAWLGRFGAATVVFGMLLLPAARFMRGLLEKAQLWKQRLRLALWLLLLIAFVTWLPIPQRRWTTGWVEPHASAGVYVPYNAVLSSVLVDDGQTVTENQPLFELTSHEVELKVSQRRADLEVAEIEYEQQKRKRGMYASKVDLASYHTRIENAARMRDNAQREQRALSLAAVAAGEFCLNHAAIKLERNQTASSFDWQGHTGRALAAGTLLGTICSEQRVAVLPLQDHQLADVAEGSEVRMTTHADSAVIVSHIQRIVLRSDASQGYPLESAWPSTQRALENPIASPNAAASHPSGSSSPAFAAIVPLPDSMVLPPGTSVDAAIVVPPATLTELLREWLYANLNWLSD